MTKALETETIDRLFLELSQATSATTRRELILEDTVRGLLVDINAFDKSGTFSKLKSVIAATALLSTCEHCGSRCIDTARFPGKAFCNECEKTGSV
jgi:hypothetical protein